MNLRVKKMRPQQSKMYKPLLAPEPVQMINKRKTGMSTDQQRRCFIDSYNSSKEINYIRLGCSSASGLTITNIPAPMTKDGYITKTVGGNNHLIMCMNDAKLVELS